MGGTALAMAGVMAMGAASEAVAQSSAESEARQVGRLPVLPEFMNPLTLVTRRRAAGNVIGNAAESAPGFTMSFDYGCTGWISLPWEKGGGPAGGPPIASRCVV